MKPLPLPPDVGSSESPVDLGGQECYRQGGYWYLRNPGARWPASGAYIRIFDRRKVDELEAILTQKAA